MRGVGGVDGSAVDFSWPSLLNGKGLRGQGGAQQEGAGTQEKEKQKEGVYKTRLSSY